MAKLTHEHVMRKDEKSPHVDTHGVLFGADEHDRVAREHEWKGDDAVSPPLSHTHLHIEESRSESGMLIWTFRPPDPREAEREIGKRTPVAAK